MRRVGKAIIILAIVLAAWPAMAGPPTSAAHAGLFAPAQTKGELPIEVRANPQILGQIIVAGFGLPFPPGYVSDPKNIALFDNLGMEMPIRVDVLARWPQPVPGAGSIRAARIQFRTLMGASTPRTYVVRWGAPRAENELDAWPGRTDWVPLDNGGYPAGAISEPPLMVTLPAAWLGQCLLKGPLRPAFEDYASDLYDRAMHYHFKVAVNEVSPELPAKRHIDFANDHEPWLYDRAATFFVAYFRSGKFEHFNQAHRAAQYYASRIGPDGGFGLLPAERRHDVKYAYIECLLFDYWLTGDETLLATAKAIAPAFGGWNYHYQPGGGFWTERNLAFSLLGATAYYEMTGDPKALATARDIFEAGLQLQQDPPPGAPRGTGCLPHLGRAHDAKGLEDAWVCSPWMSALYLDAMLRYYLISGDVRVERAAMDLGRFIAVHGLHQANMHASQPDVTVPYYLINPDGGPVRAEVDPWSGRMHAPEVYFMLVAADYFGRKLGRPDPAVAQAMTRLRPTVDWVFEPAVQAHNRDAAGLPKLPLSPPRRFNWWFRVTAGTDWYQSQQ